MSKIVCVHGIAQQLRGPETLGLEWRAALRDGMRSAATEPGDLPDDGSIAVAFFGDLFRGRKKGAAAPFELTDIDPGLEADILMRWASDADIETTGKQKDGQPPKGGWAPRSVQVAAAALLKRKFFARLTDRALVGPLKQVRWYLTEPDTRAEVRRRVASLVTDQTRIVIGHSLGSIVAYEALCQSAHHVHTFISLGSPIGLPNLIFERLDPAPDNGQGVWPNSLTDWINIADAHDIVASVKQLSPHFGGRTKDILVDNEATAHDVSPYLTAAETGKVIRDALSGSR